MLNLLANAWEVLLTLGLFCRDLKPENVLQHAEGGWVLCDFGSVTDKPVLYDTGDQMMMGEEVMRKYTTPAYRAPEVPPPTLPTTPFALPESISFPFKAGVHVECCTVLYVQEHVMMHMSVTITFFGRWFLAWRDSALLIPMCWLNSSCLKKIWWCFVQHTRNSSSPVLCTSHFAYPFAKEVWTVDKFVNEECLFFRPRDFVALLKWEDKNTYNKQNAAIWLTNHKGLPNCSAAFNRSPPPFSHSHTNRTPEARSWTCATLATCKIWDIHEFRTSFVLKAVYMELITVLMWRNGLSWFGACRCGIYTAVSELTPRQTSGYVRFPLLGPSQILRFEFSGIAICGPTTTYNFWCLEKFKSSHALPSNMKVGLKTLPALLIIDMKN